MSMSITPVANLQLKNETTSFMISFMNIALLSKTHFRFVTYAKKTANIHAIVVDIIVSTKKIYAQI